MSKGERARLVTFATTSFSFFALRFQLVVRVSAQGKQTRRRQIKVGTFQVCLNSYAGWSLIMLAPFSFGLLASLLSFRPARRPGNITPKPDCLEKANGTYAGLDWGH